MESPLEHPARETRGQLSPRDAVDVLAQARALQRAAEADETRPLLRGKNFGLLCEAEDGDAALFRRAATELGAHVAHIRPSMSKLSSPQQVLDTARMLGRLYDAVECQGMSSALVQQLAAVAGVPVHHAIASQNHPSARLAEQLGGDTSLADNRRLVLQAMLLSTIA